MLTIKHSETVTKKAISHKAWVKHIMKKTKIRWILEIWIQFGQNFLTVPSKLNWAELFGQTKYFFIFNFFWGPYTTSFGSLDLAIARWHSFSCCCTFEQLSLLQISSIFPNHLFDSIINHSHFDFLRKFINISMELFFVCWNLVKFMWGLCTS